jgi:hypothetical protein
VNKAIVTGALIVAAFVAGLVYFRHVSVPSSPAASAPRAVGNATGTVPSMAGTAGAQPASDSTTPRATGASGAPADPRLAALAVSPDNGLIEFIRTPDGKVISEIDKDPGSPSFHRPLREYVYAGDRVVALTAYRYLGDHVEVDRTMVSYKPDGSVDQFAQSTSVNSAKKP